ncbi:MAG: hypothetical protein HQK78_03880 [Desulfobacterales bacterium]|nr:hypothetical protein [Desulfobacterales bacterium]
MLFCLCIVIFLLLFKVEAEEIKSPQDRPLKERADEVIKERDELIKKTIREYGGDYLRMGTRLFVTINGKLYEDVEIEICDGKEILIKTNHETLSLEIDPRFNK